MSQKDVEESNSLLATIYRMPQLGTFCCFLCTDALMEIKDVQDAKNRSRCTCLFRIISITRNPFPAPVIVRGQMHFPYGYREVVIEFSEQNDSRVFLADTYKLSVKIVNAAGAYYTEVGGDVFSASVFYVGSPRANFSVVGAISTIIEEELPMLRKAMADRFGVTEESIPIVDAEFS